MCVEIKKKINNPKETPKVQYYQDRFTTCFKNLWNNLFWVLALQKKKSDSFKNQADLKTSGTFGAINLLLNLLPNLWEQKRSNLV